MHVEIDNRIYVKEVNKGIFRDAKNNDLIIAHYVEKTKHTYKSKSAELEKISEEFNDLEILAIELKK